MDGTVPTNRLILSDEQKALGGRSRRTPYQSGSSPPTFEIPPFNLGSLPAEVRMLIFELCISNVAKELSDGKTLAIVKALRPVPHLYSEILELFYASNVCVLSHRTDSRLLACLNPH